MDTIFFVASKLVGALLRPDTWIVLALALMVLAVFYNRRRLTLWVGSITLALLVALAIFPLGDLLLQPIQQSHRWVRSTGSSCWEVARTHAPAPTGARCN